MTDNVDVKYTFVWLKNYTLITSPKILRRKNEKSPQTISTNSLNYQDDRTMGKSPHKLLQTLVLTKLPNKSFEQ